MTDILYVESIIGLLLQKKCLPFSCEILILFDNKYYVEAICPLFIEIRHDSICIYLFELKATIIFCGYQKCHLPFVTVQRDGRCVW